MGKSRPAWLLGAVSLIALAVGAVWPGVANAQVQMVRTCTNQNEDLASERIAACTSMLKSGRLHGKPEGVAYALRGLAFLDRGDIAHAIADLNQAVALAPDFAPAYQNRGNAWYARGNFGQAIADYDATIKLDPNTPSPYVNRATVRRDLGYTEGALDDYQKAISLDDRRANAFSGRGQIYLRQHDYVRAFADFDRAVRLTPSADNYMLRGQARDGAGDIDRALSDYAEASKLDPTIVSAWTAQASIWRKKKSFDKALADYDRAVQADQSQPNSYKLRAEAYAAKGDHKRAMADISRALKFTWNTDLLKVRGELRLEDGDMEGVIHDAEAMLKLEPDNASAMALRGAAYARRKEYGLALADLDQAITGDDKSALAYGERGQIYFAKNDPTRALADFNRAIELGTISAAPYRARAMIEKSNGDIAKAMSDLAIAIQRDPRPAEAYFLRASLRKAKGETALALADLNEGLTRQPDNVAGLIARAEIKHAKGDAAGSIADYDAVLKRDPKNSAALRARAMVLIETKSPAKAAGDLDNAIQLDPKNAQLYYQRGLAREQDGQPAKAIADFKTALVYDRNMNEARKALARATAYARNHKQDLAAHEEKPEAAAEPVVLPVKRPKIAALDGHDAPETAQKTKVETSEPAVNKAEKADKEEFNIEPKQTKTGKKPLDKKSAKPTKESKTSYNPPEIKHTERKGIERNKQHERDPRARKAQPKIAAHKPDKRNAAPAPTVRYYRAGETRFTDIWNDRR